MKALFQKYRSIIMYGIFGVLTTCINIGLYDLCYEGIHWPNVASNIIAWIGSVMFAFVTNKIYVFESKDKDVHSVLNELVKFTSARLATGIMDLAIMYVGVDLMQGPAMPFKICSNVLVIILNYVFSKLFIFKKKEEESQGK